jgi:ribonucleoside-diphosphate reductase alpha chain
VTPQEHVDVLVTAQRFVDSAVSKTCNVTGETPWEDFVGIYSQVHAGGGKGCTTFNKDGKRMALLTASPGAGSAVTTDDGPSCAIDANGVRSCD